MIEILQRILRRLQFLADNDKISTQSLNEWNRIIKDLETYHNKTEAYILFKDKDIREHKKEIDRLETKVVMLEAICLIHGIHNVNLYLAKGKGYLIDEAEHIYSNGITQLPMTLWHKGPEIQKLIDEPDN
ncbi:MAG: hypothetical protein WC389_13215 [Lutibacter sp.]|jgi:hypothetical protein